MLSRNPTLRASDRSKEQHKIRFPMWVDLDGSKFNIDSAFALRPVGDGSKQCTLFSAGSSPIDGGFLIDLPLEDVFSAIQNARLMELAGMMEPEPDDQQTTGSAAHPDEGNDHADDSENE
jgi:hypothetical protein